MMESLLSTLTGIVAIVAVGSAGYMYKSIDETGLLAGVAVGSVFVIVGGLPATVMLITFFLVGSAFTKYKYSLKEEIGAAELKGGARNWRNVFANLFFPTIMLIVFSLYSLPGAKIAFLSSLSGALSDTLGSEIGVLSREHPRMIIGFKRVPPGTSGAVSFVGTLASLLGSIIIPVEAYIFSLIDRSSLFTVIVLSFLCSTFDSVLGATIQARYRCEVCGSITENPYHCNRRAKLIEGLPFIDNHAVNLISTGVVSVVALIFGDII